MGTEQRLGGGGNHANARLKSTVAASSYGYIRKVIPEKSNWSDSFPASHTENMWSPDFCSSCNVVTQLFFTYIKIHGGLPKENLQYFTTCKYCKYETLALLTHPHCTQSWHIYNESYRWHVWNMQDCGSVF